MSFSAEIHRFTQKFALLGYPVYHSLSPLIHNTAFKSLGIDAVYQAIETKDLRKTLNAWRSQSIHGFNITVPFKESVIPYIDELSAEAKTIGAVNTVAVRDGRWTGYNTDTTGFSSTLEPYRKNIEGHSVQILGAGGSARAVIYALLTDYLPDTVFVYCRTHERAVKIINDFEFLGSRTRIVLTPDIDTSEKIRLVVNATPVGLRSGESPISSSYFKPGMIAYDLIYNPAETRFLADAKARGAMAINGLEMLLGQAAAAFKLWTGLDMPMEEVRKNLSKKVANH